jgi:integrase
MVRRGGLIHLKYLHVFRDRTGKVRHYFRRGKQRVPLPGLPGSKDFMNAYNGCLEGFILGVASAPPFERGSFAALAAAFYRSPNYLALSPSSRAQYRRVLDDFNEQHGHRLVRQMNRQHVITIMGSMAERPGAASTLLKRLRTLLRFALDLGWIQHNPAQGVRSYRLHELHTWTEEEIAEFEAQWPVGSKQRLAFALLLYTGQRGSDVRRMVWSDIAGDVIRVAQQKTGEKLNIPLHPALQQILALAPRNHVAILSTQWGRPFSLKGFGNYVADAIKKAGLPTRCKSHGLRKAAARRIAEAGGTSKEIAAVTGHKTLAEVERYTRAADQERMARSALAKQAENMHWQTEANRLPNVPKMPTKSTRD